MTKAQETLSDLVKAKYTSRKRVKGKWVYEYGEKKGKSASKGESKSAAPPLRGNRGEMIKFSSLKSQINTASESSDSREPDSFGDKLSRIRLKLYHMSTTLGDSQTMDDPIIIEAQELLAEYNQRKDKPEKKESSKSESSQVEPTKFKGKKAYDIGSGFMLTGVGKDNNGNSIVKYVPPGSDRAISFQTNTSSTSNLHRLDKYDFKDGNISSKVISELKAFHNEYKSKKMSKAQETLSDLIKA